MWSAGTESAPIRRQVGDLATSTNASLRRYRAEVRQRVATRAPAALAVLVACAATGTLLEVYRFPERRIWILALDATFLAIAAGTLALLRALPERRIGIGIVAVNVLGLILNGYHALVGAPVAVCLWTLTGLLCSSALFLGWGWRAQALASLGALFGYALQLPGDGSAVLSWVTGGVYLGWVLGLSILGAELIDRYLGTQFQLVSTLQERESRLQSYFDLALVGTAILSRDRTLLEVNEELCRILGHRPEVLLGAPWATFVPPEDRATDMALFTRVLGGELSAASHECGLLRQDGASIHASISVRALPGPLGRADHLIVVVQDLTERRRAEQEREAALAREQAARREVEAASRAKDEFLAVVSHELRTPLTPIFGWTPLLRAGHLKADEQGRALDAIERSGRSLAQLIDDLLDVSRIVSGKLRLAVRPADLGPIVHAAVDSMRVAADAKRVRLELHLPAGPEYVLGDPDRLQQIVWNLVSNAIKFTDPQGRVEVDLTRDADDVVIRVRDNGRGIDQRLLPHVFERFWQADTTTARRHGGLGLGLAIVRHLVELHGGTVAVESPGPEQGAVFSVRLPATSASPAAEPHSVDHAPRTLAGVRVLVVDDETDAQDVVRCALELHGVEVRTAGNTTQALAILEGWAPTVLVSDIAMPDEDGYALIRHVRTREAAHGGHVPALAFTALARAEDRLRVLAAGFDGYVSKPVDPAQLVDAVAAAAAGSDAHLSSV
jgi:PAS domain S-box-containing protein